MLRLIDDVFLTRLEFEKWLKRKYGNEDLSLVRHRYKKPVHTPMKFDGLWKLIGLMTVWDSIGGIAEEIQIYSYKEGGQVYYLVEEG